MTFEGEGTQLSKLSADISNKEETPALSDQSNPEMNEHQTLNYGHPKRISLLKDNLHLPWGEVVDELIGE